MIFHIRILQPYADRPAAALDTLKKLRILISHAISIGWLRSDPSVGIKRPKTKEIRAWTDGEMAAFEKRWPVGTKQRAAYALMRNVGTARVDVHGITWAQVDVDGVRYRRSKTGVAVDSGMQNDLREALDAMLRTHVTIIFGRPFTVNGFSQFHKVISLLTLGHTGPPPSNRPHATRYFGVNVPIYRARS